MKDTKVVHQLKKIGEWFRKTFKTIDLRTEHSICYEDQECYGKAYFGCCDGITIEKSFDVIDRCTVCPYFVDLGPKGRESHGRPSAPDYIPKREV